VLAKLSKNFRAKFPADYTWLLHRKNCPSRRRFLKSFLTESKLSRRSTTIAKRKEKSERKGEENIIEKPEDIGHLLVQKLLISADAQVRMS